MSSKEVHGSIEVLESATDIAIANIRALLNNDNDHLKIELRQFIQHLHEASNNQETANTLARVSESLNPKERLRLIGLIMLYAEDAKSGLVAEFLNYLSADQFGPEMIIRGPNSADEGFSTKRPLRRFYPSSWTLEGRQKRISSETANRVHELSEATVPSLVEDIELAYKGSEKAFDRVKDFCHAFFKTGINNNIEALSRAVAQLEGKYAEFFLGTVLLYGSNIRTDKVKKLYEAIAEAETKELRQLIGEAQDSVRLAVRNTITF